MSISIPDAPAASVDSLAAALSRHPLRAYFAKVAPTIAGTDPVAGPASGLTPFLSFGVHAMGLDEVAAGKDPAQAGIALWRHLLPAIGGKLLAADTSVDQQTGEHHFAALTDGPFAAALRAELDRARHEPDVAVGDYELAVLQIPALHVAAVWLRGRDGQADIFIPIAPTPPTLNPGEHYGSDELRRILQPAAEAALADDDPDKGGA